MAEAPGGRGFQAKLQRLDVLLREADGFGDPAARSHTREIVQAVLELHGDGLEHVVHLLREAGEAGAALLDACARDDVVAGLLLLHGLHPSDLKTRVAAALEQIRPYLRSHGGNVEFLGVDNGVVRLRLAGSCDGCPSSAVTTRQTIEEAIFGRAPEVMAVEVEGAEESPPVAADGRALFALPVV
jgi:Fe-S cluster biogenesis protein NfuA